MSVLKSSHSACRFGVKPLQASTRWPERHLNVPHTCLSGKQKFQQVCANGDTRSMTDFLSLQAMGDNMVAVIPAFAQYLSDAAANNLPPASPATSDSVYFDILGLWMISYRASTAKWLHSSLLPLVLSAPPPGVQRGPMARMAGICVLSMLCCLATPAAVGGLRAFISGMSVRLDLCTETSCHLH